MSRLWAVPEITFPESLDQICRLVTQSPEGKRTLDKVVKLTRSILIFDNLVIYLFDSKSNNPEVIYARAVGRGRCSEADSSWGDALANQIFQTRQTILEDPPTSTEDNRLDRTFKLGIPLIVHQSFLGALILIRFGGPPFSGKNVHLAEFIANQIAMLIERGNLRELSQFLETQQRQFQLQEDFISTITHELRSPLGFIKGYATTLLRDDTSWDAATQREFLRIIDRETDHLQDLIDNILDSARLQSGQLEIKFQPVRLDSLINDVVMRARLNHPELIIHFDAPNKLNPIQGNPRRLSQVLDNLLSNAVKYAPGSEVWINFEQTADIATITVRDNGPGISDRYLSKIFERFFRNPDQPAGLHGTGLGLYICKQIIQAHRGEISARLNHEAGLTFEITLPCHLP